MKKFRISNGTVITPFETIKNGTVIFEDGKITAVGRRGVRNMVELVGASLQEAVTMATVNPARVIGIEDRKGNIEPGKDADLVILDEKLNVCPTVVKGEVLPKSYK